jgi:GntR family transcriptional regulator
MYLRLDHHSGEPIWRQIVEQVKYSIASGQLAEDDKLPSIRALAGQLKINPRTVVKAYEELAHGGLVVMRQGQGVFVTHTREAAPTATRRKLVADMARRLLAEASRLGADSKEVQEIVRNVAEEMDTDHE